MTQPHGATPASNATQRHPPGWWNETATAWWPDWKPVLTDPFSPLCLLSYRVADSLRREAIAAAKPKRVPAVPARIAQETAHV